MEVGREQLRLFNVYGERQALSNPYTGAAASSPRALLNDRAPLIFEDGNQTRDFIVCTTLRVAARLPSRSTAPTGGRSTWGTGRPTSILEVAQVIARGARQRDEAEVVNEFRAGDIRHCYADTQLARSCLGFRAEIPFEAGMQELLAWLEGQRRQTRLTRRAKALGGARPRR